MVAIFNTGDIYSKHLACAVKTILLFEKLNNRYEIIIFHKVNISYIQSRATYIAILAAIQAHLLVTDLGIPLKPHTSNKFISSYAISHCAWSGTASYFVLYSNGFVINSSNFVLISYLIHQTHCYFTITGGPQQA